MVARLTETAAAHDVALLVQFGSTVTHTEHAGSDVDLAVLFRRTPDLTTRFQDHQRFLAMEREYVERAIAAARR
jgi:predicted nucleotidyltransferase